jgi:hypothetical protein
MYVDTKELTFLSLDIDTVLSYVLTTQAKLFKFIAYWKSLSGEKLSSASSQTKINSKKNKNQ